MRRVVITGVGIISPIGNDVSTFWNNLQNGVNGIDFIKSIPADKLPVKIAGEVKNFDPKNHGLDAASIRRTDLFSQYALAAANEAMADSKLSIAPEKLGVYIGSGIGGIHTLYDESVKSDREGVQWISPLFIPLMISNIAASNGWQLAVLPILRHSTAIMIPKMHRFPSINAVRALFWVKVPAS